MTDENAFLRLICEDPNDMAPRLIYADWLEENGRVERAEEIRTDIGSGRVRYMKRETDNAGTSRYLAWRRNGFAELIVISPLEWTRQASRLLLEHPINQVVFLVRPQLQPTRIDFSRERILEADGTSRNGIQVRIFFESTWCSFLFSFPAPARWTRVNEELRVWSLQQAVEIGRNLDLFKQRWPAIDFHYLVRSEITFPYLRLVFDIFPKPEKRIGDLMSRNRTGRLVNLLLFSRPLSEINF